MKRTASHCLALALLAAGSLTLHSENWTEGMKVGQPTFKSMTQLAFGPDGILFIADTRAATITAWATGDTTQAPAAAGLKIENIGQKLAGLLGASSDQILIDDMAVNPISHRPYLAVSRGRGPEAKSILICVLPDGQLTAPSLEGVTFAVAELPDAPIDGVVGQDQRKSNPRLEAITDIAFFQDRLLVAGLSNEEFASTLRAIPFPFKNAANSTSVEIYHGSHGRFETRAPVRTFVAMNVGDHPSLLAAYTCTPLVEIPLSDLKPGAKVRGKTVAELGNRNRPIDMIVYQKNGQDYLLLANSSRGVMKIKTDTLEKAGAIVNPVPDKQGVGYETVAGWTGVDHLDKLDSNTALVLRHASGQGTTLEALAFP